MSQSKHPAPRLRLPRDVTRLPLRAGSLLVSPELACFCRLSDTEAQRIESLRPEFQLDAVEDASLLARLTEHGFFRAPEPHRLGPSKLTLQLTNRCNLACYYCCTNSGVARAEELGVEQWCTLVAEAAEFAGPGLKVGMLGGEALLVQGFETIGHAVLDRGAQLTLYTNGVLLDEEPSRMQLLGLLERGAVVKVSLAAVSQTTCDDLSRGERFVPTLRGLSSLARSGHLAQVDVMLFPDNVDETCEHFPSLRSSLPEKTRVSFGIAFRGGRERGNHVFASRAELEMALDRIAFDTGERIASPRQAPTTPRRDACHCAFGTDLTVRSDGLLFGCFRMEEPIGRYEPGNLGMTWQSLRTAPKLARFSPTCAGCPLVSLCGGGCRSDNLLTTGNAELPDCGPWRISVLSELLAESQVAALEWSAAHLRAEAQRRAIAITAPVGRPRVSLHVLREDSTFEGALDTRLCYEKCHG